MSSRIRLPFIQPKPQPVIEQKPQLIKSTTTTKKKMNIIVEGK